jgi:hypothetical protein
VVSKRPAVAMSIGHCFGLGSAGLDRPRDTIESRWRRREIRRIIGERRAGEPRARIERGTGNRVRVADPALRSADDQP